MPIRLRFANYLQHLKMMLLPFIKILPNKEVGLFNKMDSISKNEIAS